MWLSPEFVNNLVAVLNVLASQIATALDTLNFALAVDRNSESDPGWFPGRQATQDTGYVHASSRSASRRTGRTHHLALELGPWTRPRPGTCLSCRPLEMCREVPGPGTDHDLRPDALVDRLPQPRAPTPIAANTDRGPVMTPSSTPDSDSDGSVRPHPGASPTVVHGPRELLQEFTIALRNAYHEPFTAWTQGELDEMVRRKKDKDARPPTRLLPAPSKSPRRKSSRHGRFISNLRHAARHLCSVGAVKILLRGCVLLWTCCLAFLVLLS